MDRSETNQEPYFLRSARLGFRYWREQDLPMALALWGDPEVMRFIDNRGKLSDEEVTQLLGRHIGFQREHGIQYWPIFLLKGGEHVGCCGLRPYDTKRHVHELGVHIRPIWWRQGLAGEAARAVIGYAFGTLGLTGLFAGHNPNNNSSRQLLQKLGFEHTHDEYYAPTGLRHPSYFLRAERRA